MDGIFMNSEDSKTSDSHILLLDLSDKIDLRKTDKYVALSNLNIHYAWKDLFRQKIHTKKINLKYMRLCKMKILFYLMDHILYQIFKIILSTLLKT